MGWHDATKIHPASELEPKPAPNESRRRFTLDKLKDSNAIINGARAAHCLDLSHSVALAATLPHLNPVCQGRRCCLRARRIAYSLEVWRLASIAPQAQRTVSQSAHTGTVYKCALKPGGLSRSIRHGRFRQRIGRSRQAGESY